MNRRRLFAMVVMLGLGASMVVARSVQITVFEHDDWERRAHRQQEQVIEIHGPRGTIRSADGYVLATSVSRVAIQIDTKLLNYPDLFVRAAAPLLGVSEDELDRRINDGPRSVWLAQQVHRERGEQIQALAPQSVALVPDFARIYPQGSLAASVIGFVGREELRTVGRAGFELSFDAYLAGEPEQYLTIRDAIQRKVRLERLHRGRVGFDLELTAAVSERVEIPVIASGGVGSLKDLYEGIVIGEAQAVLAASIFHFRTHSIREAKDYLIERGVVVRPIN